MLREITKAVFLNKAFTSTPFKLKESTKVDEIKSLGVGAASKQIKKLQETKRNEKYV